LCLTFTESGVNAMQDRLIKIIGSAGYYVQICTFHSFCNEVIQTHPEKFPELGKNLSALTELEKYKILERIISDFESDSILKPYGNNYAYLKDIAKTIADLKKELVTPEIYEFAVQENLRFWQEVQEDVENFININGRSLKDTDLENLFKKFQEKGFQKFSFVGYIKELFHDYLNTRYEDTKEAGRARTRIKNYLKTAKKKDFSNTNLKKQQEFSRLYRTYTNELRASGRYDFEDMILFAVSKFQDDRDLLQEYQEQYQYILVDEYQDTNGSQNQALKLLGSFFPNPNIFVVGDDDQAIYRFQGASLENLLFFFNNYKQNLYKEDLEIIEFFQNYRSQQKILDAASDLIKHNTFRIQEKIPQIKKQLQTAESIKFPLIPVKVREFATELDQDYFLITEISRLLKQGVSAEEIAVLYRDNKDALSLQDLLIKSQIHFVFEKGVNVFSDQMIKQLLNLFDFLTGQSFDEDYQLFILMQLPLWNFDPFDLAKIYRFSNYSRIGLLDTIADANKLKQARVKNIKNFLEFTKNLFNWRQVLAEKNALTGFTEIIRESGFYQYTLKQGNALALLSKLTRLYEEIKTGIEAGKDWENYHMHDFIRDMRLAIEYGIEIKDIYQDPTENKIQLMTAHAAKGLEFAYVFIYKFNSKKWGGRSSKNSIRIPYGLLKNELITQADDDERRLFYVALTRAKQEAIITYAVTNRNNKPQKPSAFLLDIADNLLEKVTVTTGQPQEDITKEVEIKKLSLIFQGIPLQDFSDQARKYLKNVLKDYKLNVSNLISYNKCPRCFFYETVLKIPKLKSKSAALGTAVHSALAEYARIWQSTQKQAELGRIFKIFYNALNREILSGKEFQENRTKGERILTNYWKHLQQKENILPKVIKVEYNFSSKNIFYKGIPITGKIDRLDFLTKNAIAVVDYKTGNVDRGLQKASESHFGDYFKQLVFYKILCENAAYLDWQVKQGIIAFLESSKKNADQLISKTFELTNEHVENLGQEIALVYKKIQNLEFSQCGKDCSNEELHVLPYIF
ncbi:MAG TPA: ATP-dependent DNA helicase, partial [Candidatus Dojkabacteria bacterium]|nr:ATP-dependent DNA helicase [Candidatus Dojkabacteria bacterium]